MGEEKLLGYRPKRGGDMGAELHMSIKGCESVGKVSVGNFVPPSS